MDLKEMIYKRRSTRSYTGEPVDETTIQKIKDFITSLKPLYPDIKVRAEIVSKDSVRCLMPWITPQLVSIFSEEKEGFLENVGFLFQQLELYMYSLGLGVCWLGLGRLNAQGKEETQNGDNLKFVILLAFGHPKGEGLRESIAEFNRRDLSQICDTPDERLEPARLAPSSVNSQPWYFTHEGDVFHAYCMPQGIFRARPSKALGEMNQIDMGIALAHMYVSNPDTFRFFKADRVQAVKGAAYIGSFTI